MIYIIEIWPDNLSRNTEEYSDDIYSSLITLDESIIQSLSELWVFHDSKRSGIKGKLDNYSYNGPSEDADNQKSRLAKKLLKNAQLFSNDSLDFGNLLNLLKDKEVVFKDFYLSPNIIKLIYDLPDLKGIRLSGFPPERRETISEIIEDPKRFLELVSCDVKFGGNVDWESISPQPKTFLGLFGPKYENELRKKFLTNQFLYLIGDDSYIRNRIIQDLQPGVVSYYMNCEEDLSMEIPEDYDSLIFNNTHFCNDTKFNTINSLINTWLKKKKFGKVILSSKFKKLPFQLQLKVQKVEAPSLEEIRKLSNQIITFLLVEGGMIYEHYYRSISKIFDKIPDRLMNKDISFENILNIIPNSRENYRHLGHSYYDWYDFEREVITNLIDIKKSIQTENRTRQRKVVFEHLSEDKKKPWTISGIPGIKTLPYHTGVTLQYLVCIIEYYRLNEKPIHVSDLINVVILYKNKPRLKSDLEKRILKNQVDIDTDLDRIQASFTGKRSSPVNSNLKSFIKKHFKIKNYKYYFVPLDDEENEFVECVVNDPLLNVDWFKDDFQNKLKDCVKKDQITTLLK